MKRAIRLASVLALPLVVTSCARPTSPRRSRRSQKSDLIAYLNTL